MIRARNSKPDEGSGIARRLGLGLEKKEVDRTGERVSASARGSARIQ